MGVPDMPDVQKEQDFRKIPIDKVGVRNVHFPIRVLDQAQGHQDTVATLSMFVNLPQDARGTHMSRFLEVLQGAGQEMTADRMGGLLRRIRDHLGADSAHLEVDFPYFIEKSAPVSGARSLMDYRCRFLGDLTGETERFTLEVTVPVMTLCPCSKEISKYNSHNQRSYVRVQVCWLQEIVWIEEIVRRVESCASTPVYSLLKREDEKFVTEAAWDRPMFVEDMVRDVALTLMDDNNIGWFSIESENMESIHNHNAYAVREWTRPM